MKITNGELVKYNGVLQRIRKKKLPIPVSFIIAKNMKKIEVAIDDFEKARNELLEKYGEKDENGNIIIQDVKGQQTVKITNFKEFNKEFDELNNIGIDIPFDTFKQEALNTIDMVPGFDKLTVEELDALSIMSTETEVVN